MGLALAAALHFASRRTRWGTAMIAVVQNRDAARLMGIPIAAVVMAAFAVSTLFAGIAGVMIAPLFNIHSEMGTLFGLKAFAVAILGGITNAWGVMVAGLVFGVVEALVTAGAGLRLHADHHLRAGDRSAGVAARRTLRARERSQGLNYAAAPSLRCSAAALVVACLVAAATVNGYYVFVIANVALLAIVGVGLNVLIGLTGQVSFGHVGFYAIGAYTVAILTTRAGLPLRRGLARRHGARGRRWA